MDLNHIKLPPSLLASLYHKTLIDPSGIRAKSQPKAPAVGSETSKTPGLEYSRNNKRHLLIILNTGDREISHSENELLYSMLSACQLPKEDAVIINRKDHPGDDYRKFTSHFKSQLVFLFGIEPASIGLPVSFPPFQVQKFSNLTFLYSPGLEMLEKDKLLKSKLWLCLKRIFTL